MTTTNRTLTKTNKNTLFHIFDELVQFVDEMREEKRISDDEGWFLDYSLKMFYTGILKNDIDGIIGITKTISLELYKFCPDDYFEEDKQYIREKLREIKVVVLAL